ncbi:iron complex transport system substrate-binding protein [Cohaesibacter sp. ES.047]|uniref:heme/hemin ABC transporter substrate-binding protein n=1 Tax=Cohaesibacter sp. ES.047 TaxID=1798205 RepID=UPI000BB9005A|nr:ABC transporter substrate-binding protein [Cohaesibacter sp. ES.047]SNY91275.1 iron complex transport system substrate-binding protein [Cohaesibacter sp. ES.047]
MMKRRSLGGVFALVGLLFSASLVSAEAPQRIVSLGGSVTEILYQLGIQDRIAAVDVTSVYPPQALKDKPNVGYIRALNAEGVLAADPDLILAEHDAGPPEVVDLLKSASVPFVQINAARDASGVYQKIRTIGEAVDRQAEAEALIADVSKAFDATKKAVAKLPQDRRLNVLFILSVQDGRLMVAGENNQADAVIAMAGGTNLMDGFEGFKMVDDEALLANPPDAIVMMTRSNHVAGDDVLSAHPALKASPAIKNKRIIRMDGMYLLGFGPRTAFAVADLARTLYPGETALEGLPSTDHKP